MVSDQQDSRSNEVKISMELEERLKRILCLAYVLTKGSSLPAVLKLADKFRFPGIKVVGDRTRALTTKLMKNEKERKENLMGAHSSSLVYPESSLTCLAVYALALQETKTPFQTLSPSNCADAFSLLQYMLPLPS
jgi:hypothetical protein